MNNQTVAKEKPMVVEVNRFYRPFKYRNVDGEPVETVFSDRGVTVMFKLDYNTHQFTARYSVCNGDNFSKVTGICYAQACPEPIIGNLIRGANLYTMLFNQIDNILSDASKLTDKKVKRNLVMLRNELLASK